MTCVGGYLAPVLLSDDVITGIPHGCVGGASDMMEILSSPVELTYDKQTDVHGGSYRHIFVIFLRMYVKSQTKFEMR
jgi:hypothetical protein